MRVDVGNRQKPSPSLHEPLADRRDGAKEPHLPTRNETMDTLAPLKQLNGPEATQRGPGSLPGWSPLPWLAGQKESMAVAESAILILALASTA